MQPTGLLRALVLALDSLAILVGLALAQALWASQAPPEAPPLALWSLLFENPLMPPGLLLWPAWLWILRQNGLYDPLRMTSSPRILSGISRAGLAVLVLTVLAQFFLPDRTYSRLLILSFTGCATLSLFLFRLSFFRLQRHIPRPILRRPLAIIGVGEEAQRMARRAQRFGHPAYDLVGFILVSAELQSGATVPPERVLGPLSDLHRLINQHDLRVLVLATTAIQRDEAWALATHAERMGLQLLQVPFHWGVVANPRVELAQLGGLQLVDLTALAYPTLGEQIKRALDLALVSLGGLLISPLLLALALAIKLQDGGPVLFVQERAGRGGRKFPFYKFRSMVREAETLRPGLQEQNEASGPLFKMRQDPRITPLGRWLRRWSLDELPQLWNVLRGDMNLVGPRPLAMSDLVGAERDPELKYWFEMRSKVKPGITGSWQVSGRSDLGLQEMVQLDLAYIQDWSLWLDLAILLRTVPAVLGGRGAR
jgi:exopolysaccharide biosynthesis polyprenyl glycosylphosphotransferase